MTNFRKKLAVIFVDSELNDDDVRNRDLDVEESNTDPTDCMIVPRPPKKTKFSNPLSNAELMLTTFVVLPTVDPTNINSSESSEAGPLSQLFVLSPSVKPTNDDLIDELCLLAECPCVATAF
jgi:hypothetical protein